MNVEELPELLKERISGDGWKTIGARHGFSHTTAANKVSAQERIVLGSVAYDLYAAYRDERDGKVGEWPVILVPYGPDHTLAQAYVGWLTKRLRDLSIPLKIRHRRTPAGTAYQLLLEQEVSA